jgi:hypothetical protein
MQYYDPVQEPGCPACTSAAAPAAESSRRIAPLVVGLVAIGLIGSFFLRAGPEAPTETLERPVERMRAGPFRDDIEKMEWILYAETSVGLSDADELVFLSGKLADEMREWESRLHMTVYITDIREFGRSVQDRGRQGFSNADLAEVRFEWEAVRARVFEPEDWFARW